MTRMFRCTLGELISTTYEELLNRCGDASLASAMTAAVVNERLQALRGDRFGAREGPQPSDIANSSPSTERRVA